MQSVNQNVDTTPWPPVFLSPSASSTASVKALSHAVYLEVYILVGTVTYRIAPFVANSSSSATTQQQSYNTSESQTANGPTENSDTYAYTAPDTHRRLDRLVSTMRLLRGQMIQRVKQLASSSLDTMAIRSRAFAMIPTCETLLAMVPYNVLATVWVSAVQDLRNPEIFFTSCPVLVYPCQISIQDFQEFLLGRLPELIYGDDNGCSQLRARRTHLEFPSELKRSLTERLRIILASRNELAAWATSITPIGTSASRMMYKLDPWTSMLLINGYMSGVVLTGLYDGGKLFRDAGPRYGMEQLVEIYCRFLWHLISVCESTFQTRYRVEV